MNKTTLKHIQGDELLRVGLQLISQADDGMNTVKLKEAIQQIEELIYVRENVPF